MKLATKKMDFLPLVDDDTPRLELLLSESVLVVRGDSECDRRAAPDLGILE
jgi:hypothetical protein